MCLNYIKFSQYDGKGFGCFKNNKPDVAGVVCGDEEDVQSFKTDQTHCNE